jgi:hypothetical protein
MLRFMKLSPKFTAGAFAFAGTLFLAAAGQAGLLNTGLLGPSAKSQALGGAGAAQDGDSEGFALNPALLARQRSLSLDLQGGTLFDGHEWLLGGSLVSPAEETAVGLALGSERVWTDKTQNYQQAWSFSAGIPLSEGGGTGLGLTLRYFNADYGDPGRSLGLDLGLLQRLTFGKAALALAASVLDVDSVMQHNSGLEERLPQVIKLGLGFEWGKSFSLVLDNDFQDAGGTNAASAARQYAFHAGLEKSFWKGAFAARLGYVGLSGMDAPDPFGGSGRRATFGLGLRAGMLRADYAYLPSSGGVGASHRLAATLDLYGAPVPEAEAKAALEPLALAKAMAGDRLALLTWNDPQGGPETAYVILSSLRPDTFFSRLAQTGGGQRSIELRGLENGRDYYFKVAALDAKGMGQDATLSPAVKLLPTAPAGAVAVALDGARAALEQGNFAGAKELAEQARQAEPARADTELLIGRLQRLSPEGAK